MTLYIDRQSAPDVWTRVADEAPLREHAIVTLARWQELAAPPAALRSSVPIAVELTPQDVDDASLASVAAADMIVVRLAKFTDGRAYSLARRLREALGFEGELRASGDVLLDQLPLLERCGFDSFEITDAATCRALERGHVPELATAYQPASRAAAMRPTLMRR